MMDLSQDKPLSIENIREIDFSKDTAELRKILEEEELAILEKLQPFVESGDAACYVATRRNAMLGWVVVHLNYNPDYGWIKDKDTTDFQTGSNAYLGNIVVSNVIRRSGVGGLLLDKASQEAARNGKSTMWLHVSADNHEAIKFYENQKWSYRDTVTPNWYEGKEMCVYYRAVV